MKLKITEHNGALMVSVLGSRQEILICEDGGGFELELRERVWWEESCEFKVQVFEPEVVQKETNQVNLPVVEPEAICSKSWPSFAGK